MAQERAPYYPIFVDLTHRPVVLVGGGGVAHRKALALLEAGARLTVISPQLCPELEELARQGRFRHIPRPYRPGDLQGAWLAVAATDDPRCQEMVFQEAQERRIFCNVVDRPQLCSFIVPSQVRRGPLTMAISTGGRSPALAKSLRRELEHRFPQGYGAYVEFLGRVRDRILELEGDPERRRRLCLSLADPSIWEWMEAGEWDRIGEWLERLGVTGVDVPAEGRE